MRKHFIRIFLLCIITLPLYAQAEGMDLRPKGAGMRGQSDKEIAPQPKLRKSIDEYAKEYGYNVDRNNPSKSGAGSGGSIFGQNPERGKISSNIYASNLNSSCAGHWKKTKCLSSVAHLSRDLYSDFYNKLATAGHNEQAIKLLGECEEAASGANKSVNEHTQKKRMQKCNRTIAEIASETKVNPDLKMYQLSSWSVICLGQGRQCKQVERKLESLSKKL